MADVQIINCAPHPHVGETLTANYLRHHLPGAAAVLVNYYLPDPPGTQEIDLVVINRNGVYLLEVKHWAGSIEADQVHWRHASGDLRDSPIVGVEHKARVMHGFLKRQGWGHVSVAGLVVLSKGAGAFRSTDPNAHKVFGLHPTLIEALTGRAYVFHPDRPTLSRTELERLRDVVLRVHVAAAERRVAGYRVLDQRERAHYVELEAEDPEFPGRKVRIKQYDVPAVGSRRELEQAVTCFKRDMAALIRAGSHPNLVMPYRFYRDENSDERYYLILEWPGEQSLADRIAAGPIALADQVAILQDVAAALAHCHARDVIHRNLCPCSIYLDGSLRVRVGDFDFARTPTICRSWAETGVPLVGGRYVSPEQAAHARDVDARADIYSLGAVWYDALFRPPAGEPLDQARIAEAPLPEDGRRFLIRMLSEQRGDRPFSMLEVRHRLELLAEHLRT